MKLFKKQKGFTLIELLVVIGILAVLLAITLIAINPAKQFSQANDTKRTSDVNAILNAVTQYMADNKGAMPTGLSATACPSTVPCTLAKAEVMTEKLDICSFLVTDYLAALPVDPLTAEGQAVQDCSVDDYDTNYQISVGTTNDRVTVTAPAAEIAVSISVTR